MQSASRHAVKPFAGVVTEGSPARESGVATDAGRSGHKELSKIECVLGTWMSQNV